MDQMLRDKLEEMKALEMIAGAGHRESGWMEGLGGMRSVSIQAKFKYGSSGQSIVLRVQTSLDGGATPIDIACLEFKKEDDLQLANISADGSRNWFKPKTLMPGAIMDGILGDRLRYVIDVTGLYADATSLEIRVAAR